MNLDTRIRSALSREADSLDTPWPPPLDDLRTGGEAALVRRRRTRRVFVTTVVGALLAAATTGALLTKQPERSQDDAPVAEKPTEGVRDLPVGSPPRVLFCVDGVLRWGDEELSMGDRVCAWPDRLAQVGDIAIAVEAASSRVTLFDGEGGHELPAAVDLEASPVVMSPDGRLAAEVLLSRVDGRQQIVLWDTTRRAEWKRVVAPTPDLLNLEGIDASGRVYMTSVAANADALADRIWVWPSSARGSSFRRVTGIGEFVTVADVLPDGLAVLKSLDNVEYEGVAVWGRVGDDGAFTLGAAGEVRESIWSPDRSRYLTPAANSVSVFDETGDSVAGLQLPDDVEVVELPAWESSEQVLVPVAASADHGDVFILRCGLGTQGCEVAAEGSTDVMLATNDSLSGPR
jgi:WD40 repeat protein